MTSLVAAGSVIGLIGGIIGAVAGTFALRDRHDRRWLRRRELVRLLDDLAEEHLAFLGSWLEEDQDVRGAVRDEHNARGMLHSSFYLKEADKVRRRSSAQRRNVTRQYERRRSALQDELDRLGGPPT